MTTPSYKICNTYIKSCEVPKFGPVKLNSNLQKLSSNTRILTMNVEKVWKMLVCSNFWNFVLTGRTHKDFDLRQLPLKDSNLFRISIKKQHPTVLSFDSNELVQLTRSRFSCGFWAHSLRWPCNFDDWVSSIELQLFILLSYLQESSPESSLRLKLYQQSSPWVDTGEFSSTSDIHTFSYSSSERLLRLKPYQ